MLSDAHIAPLSFQPSRWQTFPFATALTWLLTIFLVLFPKGGIKLAGVPLTWGYMLIAFSLPVLLMMRVLGFPLVFRVANLLAISSLLPFLLVFVYSYRVNGIGNMGGAISDVVSFFVLPFAFLLIYPAFFPRIDGELLSRVLRLSVLSAAIFGIVLFVLYPFTHHLIEIPYLTVNADDYGLIEATKHINRGFFLKLISTYNNGNVYGVSTLILLPMYDQLESKAWRRHTIKLALIFTLSRTVWVGLVLVQLLSLLRIAAAAAHTFPLVPRRATLQRAALIAGTIIAVIAGSILSAGNLAFLLDAGLGGRREGLSAIVQATTVLPSLPVGPFFEIVYLSALNSFGILGMLSVILIFIFPVILLLANRAVFRSPLRLAACKGLILYMMMACLDGAVNLIPVMALYWFAYMVFLEGWPGAPAAVPAHSPAKVGETSIFAADSLQWESTQA